VEMLRRFNQHDDTERPARSPTNTVDSKPDLSPRVAAWAVLGRLTLTLG
jgi:hypothetical protein